MKVLYVLFLLDTLNLAVFIPVFSAFVKSVGGTAFTLGVINSSSALITLLWNPIAGSLSDQLGRKGLLVKCMIASSIGSLILCASSSSLFLVFIGKLVGALGSPVAILLRSTVGDIFKTDEEKKAFLNKSAPIISVAFLVGSLSSGFLSEAKNGYILSFLIMAIITAAASIVANQGLAEDAKSGKNSKDITFSQRALQETKRSVADLKSIEWSKYQELFIMRGLYDFAMVIVFSNIGIVLLDEYHIEGRSLGYVFLMIAGFQIIANLLKLKLEDMLNNISDYLKIVQFGSVLLITLLGMSLTYSIFLFLLFTGMMCSVMALMDAFWMEMITIKTSEDDRGKVLAAFQNLNPFMNFVVPVFAGLIADTYGVRPLMLSSTIPLLFTILIAYRQKDKTD